MRKNVASQVIGAQLVSATDGSAFTGSVTVKVTGDAGTQATGSVGSGACTHEGSGYHTYAPAQAETNYDLIAFTFTGTGAVPVTIQIETRIDANVTYYGGTAGTFSSGYPEVSRRSGYVARHVSASGVTTYYAAGSDTDTARGTALVAAQTAATNGTIFVDHPVACKITATLGKAAVNFSFAPGSTVYGQNQIIWQDFDGLGVTFAMGNVYGYGKFYNTGSTNACPVVILYHTSGGTYFECDNIESQSTGTCPAIQIGGANRKFVVRGDIDSNSYDGLWLDGGFTDVECRNLHGGDNAIEWSSATSSASFHLKCKIISGQDYTAAHTPGAISSTIVDTSAGGVNGVGVIECDRITTVSTSKIAIGDINCELLHVKAKSIEGSVAGGTSRIVLDEAVIDSSSYAIASLTVPGNNLVLKNCVLNTKSSETNSISAVSSKTISVVGALTYNKALSNVTLSYANLALLPKKNTAFTAFPFYMERTNGNPGTSLTVTATRSLDGAAFAACANSVTEVSNGWYKITLAAADLNAASVALKFTASGAKQRNITIIPQVAT